MGGSTKKWVSVGAGVPGADSIFGGGNPVDNLHNLVGGTTKSLLGIDTPEASAPPDPADAEAAAKKKAAEKNKRRRMAIGSSGFQSTVKNKGGYGGMANAGGAQPTIGSLAPPKTAIAKAVADVAANPTRRTAMSTNRSDFENRQAVENKKLRGRSKFEAGKTKPKKPKDMYRP